MRLIDADKLNRKDVNCANVPMNFIDTTPTVDAIVIPDNATNGDVIKALFPDIEIYDSEKMESIYTGIPFGKYIGANVDCMRDWWDAPYKESVYPKSEAVDKSDKFEEWKLNEDKDCYIRIGDIVDRFKEIDKHYNHSPWTLTQIFSNLNVLKRVEAEDLPSVYPKSE